ncbi:MAG: Rhs element Vgr protein [Pseudomonas shahriarae]|jgi:hypothetical protein|uniref:hypothetical protein n=1 Tax=Pseudomonas shahriarae TaxID=2745512 RepID=UPI003A101BCD
MLASTNRTPLKVLTPTLADRLRVFNAAARNLQAHGIRVQAFHPANNLLVITPESGQRLISLGHTEGYKRYPTAGSTRFNVQFQGVTLEWREPISASRPADWSRLTLH